MENNEDNSYERRVATGVTCVLVNPTGEMLLQLRDDCRGGQFPYPHQWCFPGGGRAESDADYSVNSSREIEEEFGIKIDPSRFDYITVYAHADMTEIHVFGCHVTAEEAAQATLHEGNGFGWIKLAGIKAMKLAWGQNELLPQIEEYLAKGR